MNNPYSLLKIGSDAEMFVWDQVKGRAVPVCGLLGGTKEKPRAIFENNPGYSKGYAVQEDNVLAEYNIPACTSYQQFGYAHKSVNYYLRKYFMEKNPHLTVTNLPVWFFPPEELQSEQAKQIGCEPDYCVWTDEENCPRDSPLIKEQGLRTSGYHLHFSYLVNGKLPDIEQMKRMVKLNDLFLGLSCLEADNDVTRRQLYGKAGAFRPKPYGHEYRVLSGVFSGNEQWGNSFFKRSVEMFYWLNSVGEDYADVLLADTGPTIREAINTGNIGLAKELQKMIRG